jgi:nicotinamide riboside transporter PnuC
MSLIPALGRQRQLDLSEFEGSVVYQIVSGQPGLHIEILSWNKTKQPKTHKKPNQTKKPQPNKKHCITIIIIVIIIIIILYQ